MSDTSLPKPLSAYVGLLVASVEQARAAGGSTAGQVVRLPLAAAGQLMTAHARYDELAQTGDVVIDVVVGMVRSRLGGVQEKTTDWLGDETDSVKEHLATVKQKTSEAADEVEETVAGFAEKASDTITAVKEASTNSAVDLPVATVTEPPIIPVVAEEPEPVAVLTPMQQLEQFSVPEEIGQQAGGLKTAADLPLADFDHMSAPQLRGRLRKLDRVQLVQLLDYERAHADRVGIVLLLENRLAKLIADGGDPV